MKTELYTNCSLVRIPVKAGVDEYYLPQNVEWGDRKIDRLVIVAPQTAILDPIDGVTPVITMTDLANCYVNLYDNANRELMHDVSFENILHRNNNMLRVDSVLNLSLCRLNFTTAPESDGTLLMYAFYGTREEEYYEMPKKSISVTFPMEANEELSLQEIINRYVHMLPAKIRGIICWDAVNNPAWLTLRDYSLTYQLSNVHTELCRPDLNSGTNEAKDCQAALFLLNDLDINFEYSNIRNALASGSTQKITFLY